MRPWLAALFLALGALAATQGQVAPDFRLRDLSGKVYTLASFRGKPVVITFWASWCPICRAEFPKLHALAQEYKVPFVVISREPRDTEQVVREYMKSYPAFLPLVALPGGDNPPAVANRYRVLGQPWTFVLDREGRVVNLYAGKVEVESLRDDLALAGYE
ncbi:MAG: TlpA family protein disulfide reductase [Meiothermus sp.]|uniref:TlpA family protein disulfide reductase n=1 Tax=Meiothermus sp. TaxID=1955249 RepID=UPI0025D62A02|nr:TlpA disulfide reductase family protein [Meiothermus sp.]MCS7058956.1 TlpA family protein disulfide reductase [Meiothermus sp.]MCS7195614.1 TlpA family protein disulfide reductase [Meiothermus sp.]MCX7741232.1 TlpA family protein disulfide reductase [Meiothermus sp.]MDW8091488.1 TlpA disulfide reductase family protein [Meiothermus sp.]MDW8480311.1 TlpA disulfide reductase family protein [Meiothermus sp.]